MLTSCLSYSYIPSQSPPPPPTPKWHINQSIHKARGHGSVCSAFKEAGCQVARSVVGSLFRWSVRSSTHFTSGTMPLPISIRGVASTTTPVASTIKAPGRKPSTVAATPEATAPATSPCHTRQIGPLGDNLWVCVLASQSRTRLSQWHPSPSGSYPEKHFRSGQVPEPQGWVQQIPHRHSYTSNAQSVTAPLAKGIGPSDTYPLG